MANNSFRNYDSSNKDSVEITYSNMLKHQTLEFVNNANINICDRNSELTYIWKLIADLDSIIDESDPDTDLPQIIHSYQTAEAIKSNYIQSNNMLKNMPVRNFFSDKEWANLPMKCKQLYNTTIDKLYSHIKYWDWFILVGFIHDLGKILLLPSFGGLKQHFVVGDTFPLGNKLDSNYVYYDKQYHKDNQDLMTNIYLDNCGFNNVVFSWGHDEYLAKILEKTKTNLPKEAIYIIRYHSFYSWHTPSNGIRGYTHLANENDWYMLPLLKCFQKADLYSKTENVPDTKSIIMQYDGLIEKYIPDKYLKTYSAFLIY